MRPIQNKGVECRPIKPPSGEIRLAGLAAVGHFAADIKLKFLSRKPTARRQTLKRMKIKDYQKTTGNRATGLGAVSYLRPRQNRSGCSGLNLSNMKMSKISLALGWGIAMLQTGQSTAAPAQTTTVPPATPYYLTEYGPNHKVWQRETFEQGAGGQIIPHLHAYTELASGMYYQDVSGQWLESQELIESYASGAIAQKGQYQAIFANNLNTGGSIDLHMPDGQRLQSSILGLEYYDTATGKAVVIAELKDSQGELIASNQVLYPDAFDGVSADVRYTYKRGSFEQDVILRQQPPSPESFGLGAQTTEMEVITEFPNSPAATVGPVDSTRPAGGAQEADEVVSWGPMTLARGQAFDLSGDNQVPVSKQYVNVNGRNVLVEKVLYQNIKNELANLPQQASAKRDFPLLAAKGLILPKTPVAKSGLKPVNLAAGTLPGEGYVLDYVLLNNGYSDYTFQGDTTYYISGNLNLCGTNTFEGDAVIKYARGTAINEVPSPYTPEVVFKTGPYRPAIFTAVDDNSVGETIPGSTGNPTGYYAAPALNISSAGLQAISGLRIDYANTAVSAPETSLTISDGQIINAGSTLSGAGGTNYLKNVLAANVGTNFILGSGEILIGQNVTFSGASVLASANGLITDSSLTMTNCIFANVTNLLSKDYTLAGGWNGFYNATPFGSSSVVPSLYPFSAGSAGNYYLADNSSFIGAGTAGIDGQLLTDLQTKTVHPPVSYSHVTITNAVTLSPVVQRDSSVPALGYHYDPLDYIADNLAVSNGSLALSNGVAIASYNEAGIILQNNSSIVSSGTPLKPNWLVRYQSVQEQPVLLGGDDVSAGQNISVAAAGSGRPAGVFQFTHFAMPANGGSGFYHHGDASFNTLLVQDSELWGGAFDFSGPANDAVVTLQNNLFFRSSIFASNVLTTASLSLSNNLILGGSLSLVQPKQGGWNFFDNDVDGSAVMSDSAIISGYNAFLNGSSGLDGAGNIVSSNGIVYQSGPLGDFYQPAGSPLQDAGSTTADVAGLYNFTTQTNQIIESNSVVDIGYHYPVLSTGAAFHLLTKNTNQAPVFVVQPVDVSVVVGVIQKQVSSHLTSHSTQPTNVTVEETSNAVFTVVMSGTPPFYYQWYFNTNHLLAGATNSILTITNVQATNAGYYSVTVSNAFGKVTSTNALLSVLTWPTITVQPLTNITVLLVGNPSTNAAATNYNSTNVVLTVTAAGTPNLQYQWWYTDNSTTTNTIGSTTTNSSLTLTNVTPLTNGEIGRAHV